MFAPNQILKTNATDFLHDLDLTTGELLYLLDLAAEVKASPADFARALDGKDFALGCPEGYNPNPEIVTQAEGLAAATGASLLITHESEAAVEGAHAIYTDVWTSMGQEQETFERKRAFQNFQVNDALFSQARP